MGAIKVQYLPHYTVADYQSWEGAWELIYGIPYAMSPSPSSTHQRVARNIVLALSTSLKGCPCEVFYELDWHCRQDTVVRPDITVLCGDAIQTDFITRAPNLIVEVLSQTTREKDRTLKWDLYSEAGVLYYVLADAETQSVEIYVLENGSYHALHDDRGIKLGTCTILFNPDELFT